MRKYIPLFWVEFYLILTLLIYAFGPVVFNGHNPVLFWVLILLYHVSFVFGYHLSVSLQRANSSASSVLYSSRRFYLFFLLAFFGVLLTYKNLMLASSIIPSDVYDEVVRGFTEPGLVYAERMERISSFEAVGDGRVLNALSIFFLFFKILFIFYFVYFWGRLRLGQKALSVMYCFIFIMPGVASGTNSVIFQFVIFVSSALLVVLYLRGGRSFYVVMIFSLVLLLMAIFSFGFIMSQRGGGFEYFALTSPLGDISVSVSTPGLEDLLDYLYYALVWMNYYLVQGYYGFSLILDVDWTWTFGFGNSEFLQRQLLVLTGVDVSELTFQSKISSSWDKSAQWHSFYGQFANDFGLLGLIVFMFMLGFFLARVWLSVINENSFYGAALIPIFVIMFVFFPANNQVFAYIDTLSYFLMVGFFWFFESKIIRWR